jgi:hypothetical protein
MRLRDRVVIFAFGFSLLFLTAIPSRAQVDTGSILGTVYDQSGAVIPGAKVTLTSEGTGVSLTTTTSAEGVFKFSPVRIGSYRLDVSDPGFASASAKGVVVNIGADVVQNITLSAGNVTQSIEVSAQAPLLESQSAAVGQVVDTKTVNSLPLNGRNFTFLAQIAAGVNSPQADTRGNAASGAFASNGLRPAQNNYLIDGIDNNSDTVDFLNGTNYVVLPPVDAVQEFKVETSNFSAEFGRSGAAVLNATIKSGTNAFHGSLWEFFRNDVLDAADFFENANQIKKGELRQNQFGGTLGGPVVKNKVFFFMDYQGLRRVQGTVLTGTVPTAAERASNYTDFSDLISGQSGTATDALGRMFPIGTVFDPATTRAITAGQVDPSTGIVSPVTGFARNPFGSFGSASCPAGTMNFVALAAACQLNQIPANRLDPNAISLMNLYPNPTTSKVFNNFANSPKLTESSNSFDVRGDVNFSQQDQVFARFSWVDDPEFIPGLFGGVADGGGFQQGNQTALSDQTAIGWTHTFSPVLINEFRAGFNYLKTTRSGPVANTFGIPAQFGIQDVPQTTLNGGLPAFAITGLSTLGSNAFLPSDEVTSTFQFTDDVTKIYGKHTFKFGFTLQHVKFSTLQPPWSHGEFDYNGAFTDIPTQNNSNTGRVNFLLIPTTANPSVGPTGVNYVGGSSNVELSNISLTDNGKNYYGLYLLDNLKVTNKLTLNLGLRWDFFGLVFEHHSAQANFVPFGPPTGNPMYIIPPGNPNTSQLSPSFRSLLQRDGIDLAVVGTYGRGLGNSQYTNFAPRIGFAYQVNPKLVVRGGWGMFYNGFENRGFSPNIGENYPFQFNFNFFPPNSVAPYIFTGCNTAGPGGTATFQTGFSCTPLQPGAVNATGLQLRGIQFNYKTPYSMEVNLTAEYLLTPTLSLQAAYVGTNARHLEIFPGNNEPSVIAPVNTAASSLVPYPDFGIAGSQAMTEGISSYNGLQTQVEKRFASGLQFLFTYTWSKTLTDAHDLLNDGSIGQIAGGTNGFRAPYVPGVGVRADYGLAPFDIRNVFHFTGLYDLPFGRGRKFATDASGFKNQVIGGWSVNWSMTFQGGQPIQLGCPAQTASWVGCGALFVPGQPLKLGLFTKPNGQLSWYGNPAAFTQPCVLGPGGVPESGNPTGCVPLTGAAALGGVTEVPGPPFKRVDFSIFKNFPITETKTLQFRTEIFNIANHPTFNAPNFGGNGVVAISGSGNFLNSNFGAIGSTRLAPYDPRQIQFALKFIF